MFYVRKIVDGRRVTCVHARIADGHHHHHVFRTQAMHISAVPRCPLSCSSQCLQFNGMSIVCKLTERAVRRSFLVASQVWRHRISISRYSMGEPQFGCSGSQGAHFRFVLRGISVLTFAGTIADRQICVSHGRVEWCVPANRWVPLLASLLRLCPVLGWVV